MKPRGRDVDRFLGDPDPAILAALIYGPNEGLVRERAGGLTARIVEDVRDPFRVCELTGDDLRGDPARLSDEAAAIAMTGGRRVIRVRDAGNAHTDYFQAILESPVGDALIIAEAGNLESKSRLRKLFESNGRAIAIPCYEDDGRDFEALIVGHLRERGLGLEGGALEFLMGRLGSDRMIARGELDKLALYVGQDGGSVSLADAEASVGDTAAQRSDQIIDAAMEGNLAGLDSALARFFRGGESSIGLLRMLARHLESLQIAADAMSRERASAKDAMGRLWPKVFWKRQDGFQRQLRLWPAARLVTAMEIVLDAESACKSTGIPDQAVCGHALMRLARAAGGGGKAAAEGGR